MPVKIITIDLRKPTLAPPGVVASVRYGGYSIGMKSNTKSSVTLPAAELKLVQSLKRRLRLSTNVEVVRRGLRLLAETTERKALKDAYRSASKAARRVSRHEIAALDGLAGEGVE